jgi:hypothetical protein
MASEKYGRKSHAGRRCAAFAPPTSIFATSWTWAVLISSWISRNVLRLAARTMQGRTWGWPAISRSIQVKHVHVAEQDEVLTALAKGMHCTCAGRRQSLVERPTALEVESAGA